MPPKRNIARTPTKEGRIRLREKAEKRAKEAKRQQAQMDQEAQITTEEKYEKLTKDYASLETAYVGLQAVHAGLAKDHAGLEEQFEELRGSCNILLKSNKACKNEVVELIGKNDALLQNVTKLTARNNALITLVKQLDPSRRSLQESASKKNNPDEKSSREVRDEARRTRRQNTKPRDLNPVFKRVGK